MRFQTKILPTLRFCSFLFLSLFIFSTQVGFAEKSAKDDILDRYEYAVGLVEELDVYEEDVFHILPKVRFVGEQLFKDNLVEADRVLTEALRDLELLKSQHTRKLMDREKMEWLQIYVDIFQKFILLGLLAYFFVKLRYFNRMLQKNKLTLAASFYLALLIGVVSIFLSIFDLSRYGESAWAFFDIQLVLIAVGGIFGGLPTGIIAGIFIGGFRWLLRSEYLIYFIITLIVGGTSGLYSKAVKDYQTTHKKGFFLGAIIGILHGVLIYFPMRDMMPIPYLTFALLALAILEGGGVFFFLAVVAGNLREQTRRKMQEDLLKSNLLFLQAQMQPHFLFNALNTISAICGREQASQAQGLVLRLADFLRRTLKRGEETVTLKEEMDYIDNYIEIERARYQDRLKVEKHIDISMQTWQLDVPILILQPLVENAVRHGLSKKEEGGTLKIIMKEKEEDLVIMVEDDGVGTLPSTMEAILQGDKSEVHGLGIGVNNIHQRLIRLYGDSYGLRYKTNRGEGTKVVVRIPMAIRVGA